MDINLNDPFNENQSEIASEWSQFNDLIANELKNKKFFLQQAKSAVEGLDKIPANDNNAVLNNLLQTQLFVPSRSDPIGIVLALNKERRSADNSIQMVLDSTIKELTEMVHDQESLNNDMRSLNSLLKKRVSDSEFIRDETVEMSNERISEILSDFVGKYLVPDLVSDESQWSESKEEVLRLIQRLLSQDKQLCLKNFSPRYLGLYRLLSKAHMLQEVYREEEPDNPFILLYELVNT
ncbi:HEL322Cp [Eremothecium sinecaudum]|uniref:HEL322Cp n=1 Tax=Eremothecium sinecaudum TaxID=45286 RepID=A0A0X8HT39_9SACH|nr:HEL322Cp [Eremothecium sinecaudum]AMD20959.1 HEL322Cp [Eremothecium sinecaudum]